MEMNESRKKAGDPLIRFFRDVGCGVAATLVAGEIADIFKTLLKSGFFMTLQGLLMQFFILLTSFSVPRLFGVETFVTPILPVTTTPTLFPGYLLTVLFLLAVIEVLHAIAIIYMENSFHRYKYCSIVRLGRSLLCWFVFVAFTIREIVAVSLTAGFTYNLFIPVIISFIIYLVVFLFCGNFLNSWLYRINIAILNYWEKKQSEEQEEIAANV